MVKAVRGASPEPKGGEEPQRGTGLPAGRARDLEHNPVGNRGLMNIFEERIIKTAPQKVNLVAPSRRDEDLEVGDRDRWLTVVKGYRSIGIAVMG